MTYGFLMPLRKLKRKMNLLRNYFYDYRRMVAYSSAVSRGDSKGKLRALMIMRYHGIEKALSLPNPRKGFGKQNIQELLNMLDLYVETYGHDFVSLSTAGALFEYQTFCDGEIDVELDRQIKKLKGSLSETDGGFEIETGVKKVTKSELVNMTDIDFKSFCFSRFSVRQFSGEDIDFKEVDDAVLISQKTPSVCNRQSSRVWVVKDPEKKKKVLEIGGGARGFEKKMGAILIVTSEMSCFQSSGERYQCWIDGGMFSMSLLYALHSKGVVTCCMNWSKDYSDDIELKECLGIPSSESVVLLIAVGRPLQEFYVAKSARMPLQDVIRYV